MKTFPLERELSNAERLRIFARDKPLIAQTAARAGLEPDEVKRRAIHVGLPKLAELLGVKLESPSKKAA